MTVLWVYLLLGVNANYHCANNESHKDVYGTLKPNCPKKQKPLNFPLMSGGLPQDNDRKRPRSGGSGLPSFSLRTASTHQRVQPAEDLTGATSAEDLTVDDQESPLVEPGTAVPARRFVRPTAVSNSLDIAASSLVV